MQQVQRPTPTPGWRADLNLVFEARPPRTVAVARRHNGPLMVQRPFYPEGAVCHVYVVHPPGGVVGGDALTINGALRPDAKALVTTPGATKFYRSAGDTAHLTQVLEISSGASLEWLPQENIFFPGAEVSLSTRVDLVADAKLALWEIHCFGRPASIEAFDLGEINSMLAIYRDGKPMLIERLGLTPGNRHARSLMAGCCVSGCFVVSDADENVIGAARAVLPDDAATATGITLLDDLLIVRYLGNSTAQARDVFNTVWNTVRHMTVGLPANTPRIWAT